MKVLYRAALSALLVLGLSGIGVAQQKYMLGYAGFAGFQAPMWAVQDLGLLKKYGLEGETVLLRGTSRQVQGLISDSLQFAHVDASGFIQAVARGADMVMVGGSLNKFPFSFVTRKEIRKPADLIGKKIGIVGFGGANDLAVNLLLKEWGIPGDKVSVIQAGGGNQRLIALSTNALDATVLSHPELGEAVRMGMNELSNLNELKSGDYPMVAVGVRRAFLKENRNVVKRFLQAYAEATYAFIHDKQKAISVYQKRLKQDNQKALEETYQYFSSKFNFPIRVSQNGMQNTMEALAKELPKLDTNLNKYLDESILDELDKEGFFKKVAGK